MKTSTLQRKVAHLDQAKLKRAQEILGTQTETETLDQALGLIVAEAEIDAALKAVRGKGRIRKVFR
jgi:Arc/MetJ family transcription regulator